MKHLSSQKKKKPSKCLDRIFVILDKLGYGEFFNSSRNTPNILFFRL